jgi:hypothetical protein
MHRAGGIMAILGELARAGLLHTELPTVHSKTMAEALATWDVIQAHDAGVFNFYKAAPGGVPTQVAFSQDRRWNELDLDRSKGDPRQGHAFSQDGGLAVLYGNIAEKGCIVKTAGVDESIWKFTGRARVFESQEDAVAGILSDQIVAGDVVVIRYEGPKGGPGMQEMLYPTSYLKSKGWARCALLTDGRFSGGTSGLSIGHASPEAACGGAIGLVEEGDVIEIDIPNRRIHLAVSEADLAARRAQQDARLEAGQPGSSCVRRAAGLCGADHQRRHRRGAGCDADPTLNPVVSAISEARQRLPGFFISADDSREGEFVSGCESVPWPVGRRRVALRLSQCFLLLMKDVLASANPRLTAGVSRADCLVRAATGRPEWDSLFARVEAPAIVQSWAYGEAKAACGGWCVERLVFERSGEPLAICQVLVKRVLGLPVAARINRGPMFLGASPAIADVQAVYGALRRRWRFGRRGMLVIAPGLAESDEHRAALRAAGFRARGVAGWCSAVLDLRLDDGTLRKRLSSNWRNHLNGAERGGLVFDLSTDEAAVEWIFARHGEHMRERAFPVRRWISCVRCGARRRRISSCAGLCWTGIRWPE